MAIRVLKTCLFMLFFAVGAGALSLSALVTDLQDYYYSRDLLAQSQEKLARIEQLNRDYDAILEQLDRDPNQLKRLATATLGIDVNEPNSVNPQMTAEGLEAARQALIEDDANAMETKAMPPWLERISNKGNRIVLFVSGAFLILIAFTCFRPAKPDTTS